MPRRSTRRRYRPRSYRRSRLFLKAGRFGSRRNRRFARRPATRRRILNVAAIKKHDNMLPMVATPGGGHTLGPIQTGTGFSSLFMPSARRLGYESVGESNRRRQVTYSVGYKETVEVNVLGGGVWKWRRVVFSYKGSSLYDQDVTWTDPFYDQSVDPKTCDMVRLIGQPTTDQHNEIRRILWDGHEGIDWSSEFTAKMDTSRVTPLFDRTYTFNPRNESGYSRTFKFWHRTGRNIVYDEDEGADVDTGGSYVSVKGKPGMGDVYVYDIMYLAVPAASGDAAVTWNPEGTYYWHER